MDANHRTKRPQEFIFFRRGVDTDELPQCYDMHCIGSSPLRTSVLKAADYFDFSYSGLICQHYVQFLQRLIHWLRRMKSQGAHLMNTECACLSRLVMMRGYMVCLSMFRAMLALENVIEV